VDERDNRRKLATNFYRMFCPDKMGEIDYIDFNYPVRDVRIEKGTRLWGFKDPRVSPLAATSWVTTSFFCIPGTPVEILGVHTMGRLKSHPTAMHKALNEYEVLVSIPHALESVCADGIDTWSMPGDGRKIQGEKHEARGGGWQYKVPHASRHMRYTTPFPQR
jgi:hypothetical protein